MGLAYPKKSFRSAGGHRSELPDRARAPVAFRPARVLSDRRALGVRDDRHASCWEAYRAAPTMNGRRIRRARARRRSHHGRVLPGRDLQGTAYPLWRQARRRMGEPANSNAIFGGSTPLAYMVSGGLLAMQTVRKLLDARRGAAWPALPRTTLLRQFDTCRAIPSRFAARNDSVLAGIAEDDAHLADPRARQRHERAAARRAADGGGPPDLE